jgi:CHAT domain-containing protein
MARGIPRFFTIIFTLFLIFTVFSNNFALASYPFEEKYKEGKRLHKEKNLNKALEAMKQAYDLAEKQLGPEHKATLNCLVYLALIYADRVEYDKAESLLQEALPIIEKKYSDKDPEKMVFYSAIGNVMHHLGRLDDAILQYEKSLSLMQKAGRSESYDYALTIKNLSSLLINKSQYSRAESLLPRALEIVEKTKGKSSRDCADFLQTLGDFCMIIEKYDEAVSYYKRSVMILEKTVGLRTRECLNCYRQIIIALICKQGSGPLSAEEENLIARIKQFYSARSQNLKSSPTQEITNVSDFVQEWLPKAMLCSLKGEHIQAEEICRDSIKLLEKTKQSGCNQANSFFMVLGKVYQDQDKYAEAETCFMRALEMREEFYGPMSFRNQMALFDLAMLYAAWGRPADALSCLRKGFLIDEAVIGDVFSFSSEKERLDYLTGFAKNNYELLLNMICTELSNDPDAILFGLDAVLKRKGIVLESMSLDKESLLNAEDPQVVENYEKFKKVSSDLSKLALSGPDEENREESKARFKSLEAERERLEKQLARLSQKYSAGMKARTADSRTIAAKLPPGSVLVEYVVFRNCDLKAKHRRFGDSKYYAFILPSSSAQGNTPGRANVKPVIIPLGDASTIDNAIGQFRQEMTRAKRKLVAGSFDEADAEKKLAVRGRALYDLAVAPLKLAIGNRKTLFLSPDGDLNIIPFDALTDETGSYLIEKYRINYCSSGKDLILYARKLPGKGANLIIADPDFDMSADDQAEAFKSLSMGENKLIIRGTSTVLDYKMPLWERLPGTRDEAKTIDKLMTGEKAKVYLDKSALEAVVKSQRSLKRLHVATHGFFKNTPVKENPLLYSGLVFAGANTPFEILAENADDGLLTSLEISCLQLDNTDLVVLSACETGVGKTVKGEGVFGLRRSFQLAGARTIVMSLWSIPDQQTKEFMTQYYTLLNKGEGKAEALRKTALQTMHARKKKAGASHPFFWAPFISVGEP